MDDSGRLPLCKSSLGPAENPRGEKKRKIIPPSERLRIFKHLEKTNYGYYVLCLVEYYLFIRRTEITKLRVHHFDLERCTVLIPAKYSKNRKDDTITIPKTVATVLRIYLKNASDQHFFTGPDFRPSPKALSPKKISDQWTKLRQELGFLKAYQFYSLKDTGITDMLRAGIPSILVRDQARHYDVSQTDQYAARGKGPTRKLKPLSRIKYQ
ncbi:tyrosine-type recombinase/integrase [Croceimicrobium hydrocarbonivorans]|uniref:Site-specific integrase n=1 Tax=Croceimicrobium hydrocarbonivorans TaxID=2761580 RepID=A0A7H0VB78_9FLAO|nr:site-specific integrase [Croceimicrobium hydrocarbonivorans]QNR22976.1 site-specific integrase [Croceimicrobium hydrocarbonivorans]